MEASQITKLLQIQNTKYINRCQTVDSSTLIWKNMIESSKYIKGVPTCNGQQNCNVPTNPCCSDTVLINGQLQNTGINSFGGSGRTTSLQTGSPQKFLNVLSGAAGSASQVYSSEIVTLQKAGKESCGVAGTSPAPENSYIQLSCGTQYICETTEGEWRTISGFSYNPADLDGQVNAIITDSSGNLYVGGNFINARQANGSLLTVNGIAKWNGSSWSALGVGVGDPYNSILVRALALIGNTLYLGGNFESAGGNTAIKYIAALDLTTLTYSQVGQGTNTSPGKGLVKALVANGSTLYVGGEFITVKQSVAQGGATLTVNGVASWNGTVWSALGQGLNTGLASLPDALILAVKSNIIYVGGDFANVIQTGGASLTVNNIAAWNGTTWSALGTGRPDFVNSITFIGNNVYAAGRNIVSNPIAYWNGSSWTTIGTLSSTSEQVDELATDGTILYAAGTFSTINGIPLSNIAKWNGTTWSPLGTGTNGRTQVVTVLNNNIYAGGLFTQAGSTVGTQYIAQYLPTINQVCRQTSNYICRNTNGPVNGQTVPVNNQSNPYLPPFDTYYAMKHPECNYRVQDQNQKHFVKKCNQCPTETPIPGFINTNPYTIQEQTTGPYFPGIYYNLPNCPVDQPADVSYTVTFGPGTPSGGTFSLQIFDPTTGTIIPGPYTNPATVNSSTGVLTIPANNVPVSSIDPSGLYVITYTTGTSSWQASLDLQSC